MPARYCTLPAGKAAASIFTANRPKARRRLARAPARQAERGCEFARCRDDAKVMRGAINLAVRAGRDLRSGKFIELRTHVIAAHALSSQQADEFRPYGWVGRRRGELAPLGEGRRVTFRPVMIEHAGRSSNGMSKRTAVFVMKKSTAFGPCSMNASTRSASKLLPASWRR
jgi:hypothetical protein